MSLYCIQRLLGSGRLACWWQVCQLYWRCSRLHWSSVTHTGSHV